MLKTGSVTGLSLPEPRMDSLTPREREISFLLAQGMTNRAIAAELCIAEGTVKKQLYNCYRKLGICSRVELVTLMMLDRREEVVYHKEVEEAKDAPVY